MISNPCTWFVNGHDKESFIYEGGKILYHFCPNDNGLEKHMTCNVVFFADNEQHALMVLARMLEFGIEKQKIYIASKSDKSDPEFIGTAVDKIKMYREWLSALKDGKVTELYILCVNCSKRAEWSYMTEKEDYCDNCVSRGCFYNNEENLIKWGLNK